MKYSVDIENGIAKEALLFNGRKYVRTTEKTDCGIRTEDSDFADQMGGEGLSSDELDRIYDALDGFFVDNLLCISEYED